MRRLGLQQPRRPPKPPAPAHLLGPRSSLEVAVQLRFTKDMSPHGSAMRERITIQMGCPTSSQCNKQPPASSLAIHSGPASQRTLRTKSYGSLGSRDMDRLWKSPASYRARTDLPSTYPRQLILGRATSIHQSLTFPNRAAGDSTSRGLVITTLCIWRTSRERYSHSHLGYDHSVAGLLAISSSPSARGPRSLSVS